MVVIMKSATTGLLQIEFQRQLYIYTPSSKLGQSLSQSCACIQFSCKGNDHSEHGVTDFCQAMLNQADVLPVHCILL